MASNGDLAAISDSCLTIACAPLDASSDPHSHGFAPHPLYEADSRAAAARRGAYMRSWNRAEAAIERAMTSSHASLASSLSSWAAQSPHPSSSSLATCLLIGPPIDQLTLSSLVRHSVTPAVASLDGSECASLSAAVSLFVARALAELGGDEDQGDEVQDLVRLAQKIKSAGCKALALHLTSPSAMDAATFSDLVCALQASLCGSGSDDAPPFLVVLQEGASANLLLDSLSHETLSLLELQRFLLPSAHRCWEEVIRELYLDPSAEAAEVLLGARTLDFIRSHFFDNDSSVESLKSCIKLALLHHFTSRPLSAFSSPPCMTSGGLKANGHSAAALSLDTSAWLEPAFVRLRLAYFSHLLDVNSSEGPSSLSLPDPTLWPSSLKPETDATSHAHAIIEDDAYALDMIGLHRREWECAQWKRCFGVGMLRLLQRVEGQQQQRREEGDDGFEHRREEEQQKSSVSFSLAEIYISSLSKIQTTTSSLKRRLKSTCDRLRDTDLSTLQSVVDEAVRMVRDEGKAPRAFGRWWKVWSEARGDELAVLGEALGGGEGRGREAKRRRVTPDEDEGQETDQARFERVSRELRLNEEAKEAKIALGRWFFERLSEWLLTPPTSHPLSSLWFYDDATHLTSLLDASPRSSLLVALSDPSAYLPTGSPTPDVARAWALQSGAGRCVNLADWMETFAQGLEGEGDEDDEEEEESGKAPPGRASRAAASSKSKLKPAPKRKADKEQTQARFAVALNHLVAMGFLKRTARRPEHVMRAVFDLPPAKV